MGMGVTMDIALRGHVRSENMIRQQVRFGYQLDQQLGIGLLAECPGQGESRAKGFPNLRE